MDIYRLGDEHLLFTIEDKAYIYHQTTGEVDVCPSKVFNLKWLMQVEDFKNYKYYFNRISSGECIYSPTRDSYSFFTDGLYVCWYNGEFKEKEDARDFFEDMLCVQEYLPLSDVPDIDGYLRGPSK